MGLEVHTESTGLWKDKELSFFLIEFELDPQLALLKTRKHIITQKKSTDWPSQVSSRTKFNFPQNTKPKESLGFNDSQRKESFLFDPSEPALSKEKKNSLLDPSAVWTSKSSLS